MTDEEEARGEARGDHVSAAVMRRWARLIGTSDWENYTEQLEFFFLGNGITD